MWILAVSAQSARACVELVTRLRVVGSFAVSFANAFAAVSFSFTFPSVGLISVEPASPMLVIALAIVEAFVVAFKALAFPSEL